MVSRLSAQPPASQTPGGGAEAPTLPTMSKLITVEPEEDVRSRMDTLIITDVGVRTAPTVSDLKEKSESGTGPSGGEKTASGETRAPFSSCRPSRRAALKGRWKGRTRSSRWSTSRGHRR
jgi:hypothetical protein